MKNKEFYRDKIIKCGGDLNFCAYFINKYVLPYFDTECSSISCNQCRALVSMWLEEDYKLPHIEEQDKMIKRLKDAPVDTMVYVRNEEDEDWKVRYLKAVHEDLPLPFECFSFGATSKTYEAVESFAFAKPCKTKFKLEDYESDVVMHCNTEEKAKKFCRFLHENGRTWRDSGTYINGNLYTVYWERTCYNFHAGLFGSTNFYEENGYTILEFDDFDWED